MAFAVGLMQLSLDVLHATHSVSHLWFLYIYYMYAHDEKSGTKHSVAFAVRLMQLSLDVFHATHSVSHLCVCVRERNACMQDKCGHLH